MFDRNQVIQIITYWDDEPDALEWLVTHKDRYMDALNAMGEYVTQKGE